MVRSLVAFAFLSSSPAALLGQITALAAARLLDDALPQESWTTTVNTRAR
jgi:hypothetical protein